MGSPGGNILGSISIIVSADTSKLQADLAQAQLVAQVSGSKIASSLNQSTSALKALAAEFPELAGFQTSMFGAAKGAEQLSLGLTHTAEDLFANAKAGEQLGLQFTEFEVKGATALAEVNTQAEELDNTLIRIGSSAEEATAALGGTVSQARQVGGALRVAGGQQSILAAEQFLATLPGVSAAVGAAFPLFGAIALFEMLGRLIGRMGELSEAEKHLAEVTRQNDAEWERLAVALERTNVERITSDIGKLSGLKLKGFYDKAQADADRVNLQNTQNEITAAQKRFAETEALYSRNPFTATLQAFNPLITGMRLAQGSEKDQIATLNALKDTYGTLAEKLRVFDNQQKADQEQLERTAAQNQGALAGARLAIEERTLSAGTTALIKAATIRQSVAHAAIQRQIDDELDAGDRTIDAAAESVRVAQERENTIVAIEFDALQKRIALIRQKGAAEKLGRPVEDQAQIDIRTGGEVTAAEEAYDAQILDAYANRVDAENRLGDAHAIAERGWAQQILNEWENSYDKIKKAREKAFIEAKPPADLTGLDLVRNLQVLNPPVPPAEKGLRGAVGVLAGQRVGEIESKGKGETEALEFQREKLLLEQRYGLEVGHTGAQQIAYLRQIETLDAAGRAAKIAGLEKDLKDAKVDAGAVAGTEKQIEADARVASLEQQTAKARAESDNAAIAAATKRLEIEQRLTLEYRLRSALNRAVTAVPGAIGGGLAKGIIDGKGIGRDIRDELRGVGQQFLGTVFKDLIEKIGVEIISHTILGAILIKAGILHQVAEDLNTKAVLANTFAIEKQAAASAVGGIGGAAGGAASGAGGAVSAASSVASSASLVGPLISAAGGIIGGAISAFATWVGDNKIVKAVNATTAAVLSLKGSPVAAGSTAGGVPGGSTINPASGQASSGSVVSDIGRKLFGSDNTAAGTPVRIVGIGAASAGGVSGLLEGIFGFGGGDALPVRIVDAGPLGQGGIGGIIGKVLGGFLGFAEGGDPPTDRPSFVGEKGKEIFWPKAAGTIIPNHKIKDYTTTAAASVSPGLDFSMPFVGLPAPNPVNSLLPGIGGNSRNGDMHFHGNMTFNGVQNVRQLMREISIVAKNQSPGHSPYASR